MRVQSAALCAEKTCQQASYAQEYGESDENIWFCCAAALMRCTTKKNERVAAAYGHCLPKMNAELLTHVFRVEKMQLGTHAYRKEIPFARWRYTCGQKRNPLCTMVAMRVLIVATYCLS